MSNEARHLAALEAGQDYYLDEATGYQVLTRQALLNRGRCCGCGCRHCPFQHANVPQESRAARIQNPAFLHGSAPKNSCRVLFWSGGKDSFLALRAMIRESDQPVVLVTTFDSVQRQVAHQEVHINDVVDQAVQLGLPLLGIPLHAGRDYLEQLFEGLALLPALAELAFGDLHLDHIREWRESNLGEYAESRGIRLSYPVWLASYESLLDDLEASGADLSEHAQQILDDIAAAS